MLNLTSYTEEALTILEGVFPMEVKLERRKRAEAEALWNSAERLEETIAREVNYRQTHGYTENEEARGLPDMQADRWQEMRRRIRELRGIADEGMDGLDIEGDD